MTNHRSGGRARRGARPASRKHFGRRLLVVAASILLVVGIFRLSGRDAAAASDLMLKSGLGNYCLDDHAGSLAAGNPVDIWNCNDTSAQGWSLGYDQVVHAGKYCLSVAGNGKNVRAKVVLSACEGKPGQIWLRDKTSYINPNSGLCLSSPNSQRSTQLLLDSCGNLGSAGETWTPENYDGRVAALPACGGNEGQKVACVAAHEWARWQSSNDHEALLNTYTAGTPYEEWCADFISYVYKQAGYPLHGAYRGWDENNANNLQNYPMFTKHMAASGYVPRPGDIAWFDYGGGHVEIVLSGGKHPTFIYGNSAEIDPTTGNGQMRTNTLVNDGPEGQLVYYLSPKTS